MEVLMTAVEMISVAVVVSNPGVSLNVAGLDSLLTVC